METVLDGHFLPRLFEATSYQTMETVLDDYIRAVGHADLREYALLNPAWAQLPGSQAYLRAYEEERLGEMTYFRQGAPYVNKTFKVDSTDPRTIFQSRVYVDPQNAYDLLTLMFVFGSRGIFRKADTPRRGMSRIDTSLDAMIRFLHAFGVRQVVFVDFSCSLIDQRARRQLEEKYPAAAADTGAVDFAVQDPFLRRDPAVARVQRLRKSSTSVFGGWRRSRSGRGRKSRRRRRGHRASRRRKYRR
jgi:hypothetical protein